MRIINWNQLAKIDYFENIDFLLKNWSEKEGVTPSHFRNKNNVAG